MKQGYLHTYTAFRPGFTLLEILVSVVVLAIGCLAVISMQTSTMEGGARAYNLTVASFLAESEIERLQTLSRGVARAVSPDPAHPATAYLTRDGSACDISTASCYKRTTTIINGAPTSQNLWVSIRIDSLERKPGKQPAERSPEQSLVYDTLIFFLDF